MGVTDEAGLNVIADLHGDSGLCEAARNTLDAIRTAGLGFSHVDLSYGDRRAQDVDSRFLNLPEGLAYPLNLLYFNINTFPRLGPTELARLTGGRYTIAYWLWELSRLPPTLCAQFEAVDEVWVPSHFVQNVMAAMTTIPVRVVPLPIVVPAPDVPDRARFGLPANQFVFLFSFSAPSTFGRKNPWAVIAAFTKAFGKIRRDGPVLVIKAHHLDMFPEGRDALRQAVVSVGGILLEETYSRQEMNELLACADAYASLHRTEGYGLGMAESMYLGKPVIGTQYSGNLDFMNYYNSYPVRYHLRPIVADDHRYQPRDAALYQLGELWAEPDIEQAAAYMRHIYEHQDEARARGARAAAHIRQHLSPAAVGAIVAERLSEITPATRAKQTTPFYQYGGQPHRWLYFRFDTFVPGSGWGGPECSDVNGAPQWFQWTCDTASTFDVCVAADADAHLEVRVLHGIAPDILTSLTLTANDQPLRLSRRQDDRGATILRGVIPQKVMARNPRGTRLAFHVNRVVLPREVGIASDDFRRLGVAVSNLRLMSLRASDPQAIGFDEPVRGSGWHAPEVDASGATYAWMSGAAAHLEVLLAPGHVYAIECCVLQPPQSGILETLTLAINDQQVPFASRSTQGNRTLLRCQTPRAWQPGPDGMTRLTFRVARTFSPHALDLSQADTRTLGVAVDWVHINPLKRQS